MMPLTGALVGMLAATGILLAVAGWRGVTISEHAPGIKLGPDVGWRTGLIVAGFVVGWLVTGWPAIGAMVGIVAWAVPMLVATRRDRDALAEKSNALAVWTEMLRDTISAHAGLRESIAVTQRVAPGPIRPYVQALAVRSERGSLGDALRRFADDVEDPIADLVVAALVIADNQGQRLPELLGHIAASAREQSAMRIRIETGRARTYATARAMVVITAVLAAVLMATSSAFLKPYSTVTGQFVLLFVGALFGLSLWTLVRFSRPAVPPRLFTRHDKTPVTL
jgi:tight adherence protein B